jgi:hypothetical protein
MSDLWQTLLEWIGMNKRCPRYTGPGSLRGVGVDYNWPSVDYRKAFRTIAKCGCNVTSLEFFGWSTTIPLGNGLEPLKNPYLKALKAARKYGGWLFVSVCNDNQGSGKYGDKNPPWSEMDGLAKEAIDWLASLGPKGQIIQPVSETQSEWGRRFEAWAIGRLNESGIISVYNRASRPTAPALGATRNAYHPFKVNDVATPDDIIVTDTGTILNALVHGGIYGGDFKDDAVYDYARRVRQVGQRDLIVYAFTGVKEFDIGACKAVGAVWE